MTNDNAKSFIKNSGTLVAGLWVVENIFRKKDLHNKK